MLDIAIRNGDVIDGSGSPRQRVDIGIADGRIVQLGGDVPEATNEIDATGNIVAPGFIDVHTHLDAQGFWDTTLSPSPLHGVTSVIGGNCGFTIAPLSEDPADGEYLMRMLARVEGMPLEALETGVPWNWKTTGEYLGALDGTLAINAGFMVGHSAVRRVVMGADCTSREATDAELDQMIGLFRDGLDAGGLGFSSSWSRTHNDADGAMVPSRFASRDEVIAFCAACADFDGTSLEFIPSIGPFEEWATDLMADMSVAAQRQLNWNVMTVSAGNLADCQEKLKAGDIAAARGGKVVALTVPQPPTVRLNFAGGFVLDALPEWESAMLLPRDEKMALLSDPAERQRLLDLSQQPGPLQGLADWANKVIFDTVAPENEAFRGRRVGDIAEEQSKSPFDALVDIALADDLATSFGSPTRDETDDDWKARLSIWRDSRAVIGASDAGAHLDLFSTANFSTIALEEAVRKRGILEFEEMVHLLTDVQARLYGLTERGRIAEGWHADVVVFDPTEIGTTPIELRADLPGGASRLYTEGTGIDHVICNGHEIVRDGAFTDARPGTILRSGVDTSSPDLS